MKPLENCPLENEPCEAWRGTCRWCNESMPGIPNGETNAYRASQQWELRIEKLRTALEFYAYLDNYFTPKGFPQGTGWESNISNDEGSVAIKALAEDDEVK